MILIHDNLNSRVPEAWCRAHMFLSPRHSWQKAQICMDTLNLVPIRKTAERLDVSVRCAFNNRYNFLSLLEEILGNKKELMAGTIKWFHCHIIRESLKENRLFRINACYESTHTYVGERSDTIITRNNRRSSLFEEVIDYSFEDSGFLYRMGHVIRYH